MSFQFVTSRHGVATKCDFNVVNHADSISFLPFGFNFRFARDNLNPGFFPGGSSLRKAEHRSLISAFFLVTAMICACSSTNCL